MINFKRLMLGLTLVTSALLVTACSSGGGSSSGSDTGSLSINVTDAPVDGVASLFVAFDSIDIRRRGEGSPWISFDLGGIKQVDLLTLTGDASEPLLDGVTLDAGTYSEIRLNIVQNGSTDNEEDSYLVTEQGESYPLFVPSGSESGLKIKNDFVIAAGGTSSFTIDFDLAKSLIVTGSGDYALKPVLRLVNDLEYGHISGSLEATALNDASCDRAESVAKVYLFEAGVTPVEMTSVSAVITSAVLELNAETGMYDYTIGFVASGDYTVALTCDGDRDDPIEVDNQEGEVPMVVFFATEAVTVVNGETAQASFPIVEAP